MTRVARYTGNNSEMTRHTVLSNPAARAIRAVNGTSRNFKMLGEWRRPLLVYKFKHGEYSIRGIDTLAHKANYQTAHQLLTLWTNVSISRSLIVFWSPFSKVGKPSRGLIRASEHCEVSRSPVVNSTPHPHHNWTSVKTKCAAFKPTRPRPPAATLFISVWHESWILGPWMLREKLKKLSASKKPPL